MQVIIKNQFKNQQMRKITLFIALITFFNINSQTVMTFNSSQEITDLNHYHNDNLNFQ